MPLAWLLFYAKVSPGIYLHRGGLLLAAVRLHQWGKKRTSLIHRHLPSYTPKGAKCREDQVPLCSCPSTPESVQADHLLSTSHPSYRSTCCLPKYLWLGQELWGTGQRRERRPLRGLAPRPFGLKGCLWWRDEMAEPQEEPATPRATKQDMLYNQRMEVCG